MSAVVWVGALFLLGIVVLVAEVFVPSGGVLGFVSLASFVASIAMAYAELGVGPGTAMLGLAVAAVPVVLGLAFRWFPETPLGKRVLPPPPEPADVIPDRGRARARELVGRVGRAEIDLLPWGRVVVGPDTLDAVSDGGPIDAGAAVEVVGAQGAALVVRRQPAAVIPVAPSGKPGPGVSGGDTPDSAPSPSDSTPAPAGSSSPADRLSPTLESFTFESLDSPDA